jgi:hypothetical protein
MQNTTSSSLARRLLTYVFIGILGLVSGLGVVTSLAPLAKSSHQAHDGQFLITSPQTLEELSGKSDLIIIGTVGRIVREGTFAGYDKNGSIKAKDQDFPDIPLVPFADYEVTVEQVIKDNGTVQSGKPFVLRMPGMREANDKVALDAEYPMSAPGDHHLFFLTQNPDKTSYGLLYGPYSRLDVDASIVTFSDGPHTPVDFNGKSKPDDFIKKVKAVVEKEKHP